jgi:hypothetical protein
MKKSERKETLRGMCREGSDEHMLKNANDMINMRYKKYIDNIGMKQKKEVSTIEMKHKNHVENIGHRDHDYNQGHDRNRKTGWFGSIGHHSDPFKRYYTGENGNKTYEIGASVRKKSEKSEIAIEIASEYKKNMQIIEKNLDMIMSVKNTIETLRKLNLNANNLIGEGEKVDLETEGATNFLKLAGVGKEQIEMSEYMQNIKSEIEKFNKIADAEFLRFINNPTNEKYRDNNLITVEINTNIVVNVLSLIFFENGKGISQGDKDFINNNFVFETGIIYTWNTVLNDLLFSSLSRENTENDRIDLYKKIMKKYTTYLGNIKELDTTYKNKGFSTVFQ